MKKIIFIIRKLVVAFGLLYSINIILLNTGLMVPINIVSVSSASLLGIPAIISLLLIKYVIR